MPAFLAAEWHETLRAHQEIQASHTQLCLIFPLLLWQVSRTCRQLAAATERLISSSGDLDTEVSSTLPPPQMGSRLLRRWAPLVSSLHLDENSHRIPGLPAFVKAARHAQQVYWYCDDIVGAAHAAFVLSSCSKASHVTLRGEPIPHAFPAGMTHLDVLYGAFCSWDPHTPSTLIYDLARQGKYLEQLVLEIESPSFHLACPGLILPELELELNIKLDLASSDNRLSWLQQQPFSKLSIGITICTSEPACHQKMIDQLQQLPVDHLLVDWRVPPSLQLQLLWQAVTPSSSFRLWVNNFEDVPSAATTLQALPCCPRTEIRAPFYFSREEPLAVTWAALSRTSKFGIHLGPGQDLHVLGAPGSTPDIEGPWQLVVHGGQRAHGLFMGVRDDVHFLQNVAAVSAGWTVEG